MKESRLGPHAHRTFGGELRAFPYQRMATAALNRLDDVETLHLVSSSHEMEITGRNLRDLSLAFQDFAVKWVRSTPERLAELVESDGCVVTGIRITAMQAQG